MCRGDARQGCSRLDCIITLQEGFIPETSTQWIWVPDMEVIHRRLAAPLPPKSAYYLFCQNRRREVQDKLDAEVRGWLMSETRPTPQPLPCMAHMLRVHAEPLPAHRLRSNPSHRPWR
jgi:hypothetical protein